ncbi:MAG: Eco57I restriction-modification methylase domain-containing protein [Bacteroidetes bacterium]|nr:Eco57I restriction-modification methylase domain-containing protein [Bacteroidota bacterium]
MNNLKELKPRKALNKAFLKVKPNRTEIEGFKANLIALLDRTNDTESEEFHKNLVSDFLKDTYYKQNHFINTKGRNDLVIHNGQQASSTVGVIIEAKKPTNKTEMITRENLNKKAFQELVLYYLRERISHKNLEVKHLVATNINEWFIFNEHLFEKLFAQNKAFVRQFEQFEASKKTTEVFYKEIAEPFIDSITSEIEFTYFNLQDFQKPLRNSDEADDNSLIALFKILSPEHLLKLPFSNDSNSLDKRFYSELLHIIGLTETKEGGKKLIERNKEGERHTGTILEDAIIQLDSLDKLSRLEKPSQFGNTQQEKLFNVALELSITWINRILFLKLLEAQLITYQKGDKSYSFLNLDRIKNYDDLNSLFFQVLARKQDERNEDVKKLFEKVPYLNSSLFEPTSLEQLTLFISNLKDDKTIPIFSQTVLKDQQGKKRTGKMTTLHYLFEFLDAYDFGAEGSEEIQEDSKTLITASVLGLIFEKINGYKDGSFFTPGFITMYMCRETIRKAVVQKFNETKNWNCNSLEELYDKIEDRKEANQIVNSIKICDPAVGSGHFLVSALNEMIAVKNDLKILLDRDGKRLKEYQVEVVNDELVVTDEEGELFEYYPNNKESQRIQETLFHEKQNLIENCLFGVDINSNSVKICRLRLWIELLKNAYYKNSKELETLPNIDINIKCGNSLVSRFPIDADLKQALKKSKWTIDGYRIAVDTYRNAQSKEQKREMEQLIADIKSDFRSEISQNDPKVLKLRKLSGELFQLTNQVQLFERSKKEKADWNKKVNLLTAETQKLEKEIEEIKANKIFENAFEWRFEFPEVLNDNGDFAGFDVVIGNPPYIRQEEFSYFKPYLLNAFIETGYGTADLFVYFVELAMRVLKQHGEFAYIIPNKWMRAGYGKKLREFVAKHRIHRLIDFGDLPVFEEATTYPNIIQLKKSVPIPTFNACNVTTLQIPNGLAIYLNEHRIEVKLTELSSDGWTLLDTKTQALVAKIKSIGIPLGEYVSGKIYYGIKTGLNEAFVIDAATKEKLIAEDPNSAEVIKPFLAGRDIKRYQTPVITKFLILFPKGFTIKRNSLGNTVSEAPPRYGNMPYDDAWTYIKNNYPAIAKHLWPFREKAEKRTDKGDFWWELRACDYYSEFDKPKVMLPDISMKCEALMDQINGYYSVNTAYIIPGLSLSDLGILNSRLTLFFYSQITQSIRGGYFRFIRQYLEQIPIIKTSSLDEKVQEIIKLKKQNPSADTADLENQIDQLVYQLYELTEEEIKIVEGNG